MIHVLAFEDGLPIAVVECKNTTNVCLYTRNRRPSKIPAIYPKKSKPKLILVYLHQTRSLILKTNMFYQVELLLFKEGQWWRGTRLTPRKGEAV
jgi:hypothetical protein